MENRKTRIAIVHNGKDSNGYALIERILAEPTITELFEPVIVELSEEKGIKQVVAEYKEGNFDAVVDVTDDNQTAKKWEQPLEEEGKGITLLLTENMRMALIEANTAITAELLTQTIENIHKSLRRDFRISSPRIAILYQATKADKQDDTIVAPAIKQLSEQSIQAYGPYNAGDFFENGRHLEFDAVIATDAKQGIMHFNNIATDDAVRYLAGLSLVVTAPCVLPPAPCLSPLYYAIDIARHRLEYDLPLANPLKKLYKDRKDDSEKVRFNIPKKKDKPES